MAKALLLIALAGVALCWSAQAYEAKLDSSKRAQQEGWKRGVTIPQAEFAAIRRAFRPESFDEWLEKLKQLHAGMSREEIVATLKPKAMERGMGGTTAGHIETVVLDDAYFVGVMMGRNSDRMTWATPPIARSYEVERKRARKR
jgi:hypothetical protein